MSVKTTSQKRAELKQLGKKAKDNLYDMLRLADEIIKDHEYVDQFGGEGKLIEHLQETDFSHFGGSPKLSSMLNAYRANPRRETWQEYQHNVWAMIDLAKPPKEQSSGSRKDWKALCQELQLKIAQLEEKITQYESQIVTMSKESSEYRHQRDILEGRLIEIEKRGKDAA